MAWKAAKAQVGNTCPSRVQLGPVGGYMCRDRSRCSTASWSEEALSRNLNRQFATSSRFSTKPVTGRNTWCVAACGSMTRVISHRSMRHARDQLLVDFGGQNRGNDKSVDAYHRGADDVGRGPTKAAQDVLHFFCSRSHGPFLLRCG